MSEIYKKHNLPDTISSINKMIKTIEKDNFPIASIEDARNFLEYLLDFGGFITYGAGLAFSEYPHTTSVTFRSRDNRCHFWFMGNKECNWNYSIPEIEGKGSGIFKCSLDHELFGLPVSMLHDVMETEESSDAIMPNIWNRIFNALHITGLTQALAINCTVTAITEENINLSLPRQYSAFLNPKQQTKLNDAINQYFGKTKKLNIQLETES